MQSSIPDVIEALVDLLAAAGLPAIDGANVSDAVPAEAVMIGYAGDEDTTAVEGTMQPADAGMSQLQEAYTIRCAVEVTDGDAGRGRAARRRAYQLFGAVGQALITNPHPSGVEQLAAPSDHTMSQDQTTDEGVVIRIVFGVAVQATTRE